MDMDYCVCCGRYVPEGTWICKRCMEQADGEKPADEERKPVKAGVILIRRKDRRR